MSDPKVLFRPLKLGGAGGGAPYGESGVPEEKPVVVKKQKSMRKSMRKSCDICNAFHRTCIMAVNEEDPRAVCVRCNRLNKLCTYDRSQFQAEAKKYRKRNKKAPAAEQENLPKTVQHNSGNEAESQSPSLASNCFEPSLNHNSTTMLMESDNYIIDGLSASNRYYSTDHSAFNPLQSAPYQQSVIGNPLISYNTPFHLQHETPMVPRPMERSQLAAESPFFTPLESPSFRTMEEDDESLHK